MFGAALEAARKIAAGNRWLVVAFAILAGLWGLELLAERAISLTVKLETAQPQIAEAQARARQAVGNASLVEQVTGRVELLGPAALRKRGLIDPLPYATKDGASKRDTRVTQADTSGREVGGERQAPAAPSTEGASNPVVSAPPIFKPAELIFWCGALWAWVFAALFIAAFNPEWPLAPRLAGVWIGFALLCLAEGWAEGRGIRIQRDFVAITLPTILVGGMVVFRERRERKRQEAYRASLAQLASEQ